MEITSLIYLPERVYLIYYSILKFSVSQVDAKLRWRNWRDIGAAKFSYVLSSI